MRRLSPVLLAVLCIVAHLGALLHMALAEHVACVEHGDLIHVDRAPVVDASEGADEALYRASHAAADAVHEHCAIATYRRHDSALAATREDVTVTASAPPPVAADVVVVRAPVAPFRRFGIALLRLAPKSSPPA